MDALDPDLLEDREAERAISGFLLDGDLQGFEETGGNPLFAWIAWQDSRRAGVPLPEWAAGVLDRWAAELGKLAESDNPRATEDVSDVLGLTRSGGERSAFYRFRQWQREYSYVHAVVEALRANPSLGLTGAWRAVARREGVSFSTVRRVCLSAHERRTKAPQDTEKPRP